MKQLIERSYDEGELQNLGGLHPVFKRVLASRGISSPDQIDYQLGKILAPASIRNISEAAELLANYVQEEKQVVIFGDYDADGATSTALCVRALNLMGHGKVDYLMPDRFLDGYGLSLSAAQRIQQSMPDCVITVDNGIASFDGIDLLRQHDIEVIVTDHHLPARELPNASVIVNQNAWGESLEGRNLAGVGIAFYLMLMVRSKLRDQGWFNDARPEPNLACCLDLVAIGSIADLVPLDHLNRLLINEGLRRIQGGVCTEGIKSLVEVSGKQLDNFTSSDIAFSVAPRINAAGRLDDMTIGVQCLLADDSGSAQALATELDNINQVRKDIQQQMADEAMLALKKLDQQGLSSQKAIVLYQPDWHEGIVGIVASKLKEKFHRPSIVFGQAEDGSLKGSGRSIAGIHLRDMLDVVDKRIPGKILKFGGHAMAAGLSLASTSLDEFKGCFNKVIEEFADPGSFTANIEHDGALEAGCFNLDFATALQNLSPWGQGFPMPSFIGEFEVLAHRVLAEKHIKFTLAIDTVETAVDAIAFFQPASILNQSYDRIRIHYELNLNRFRGVDSVQLLIRDFI